VIQGYSSITLVVQGKRDSTVVLGLCTASWLVQGYTSTRIIQGYIVVQEYKSSTGLQGSRSSTGVQEWCYRNKGVLHGCRGSTRIRK